MSQSRPFKDDPASYRNTGIPRGNIKRYDSHDVMRMGGQKARLVEEEPVETETRKELRELAKRQADTDITLTGTLSKKKRFVGSSIHQPLKDELYGQMSLQDYQAISGRDEQIDQLRMLGLSEEEIVFKMKHESKDASKESNKIGINPAVIQDRLQEINEKMSTKEEYLKRKDKFQPRKTLGRHEMDLEKSLVPNDPMSAKIRHLLVSENTNTDCDSPKHPIVELLEEVTERANASKSAKPESDSVKEVKVKCVRCQQTYILAKYGHCEITGDDADCSECQHLQRMEKLRKDNSSSPSVILSTSTVSTSVISSSSIVSSPSVISSSSSTVLSSVTSSLSTSRVSAPSVTTSVWTNHTSTHPIQQAPDSMIGPLKRGQLAPWTNHEEIEEVPERILERFKLTLNEIKMIPKFKDYTPGEPSKTLFLKNLSAKVTEHDLVSIFRRYEKAGPVNYRLLTGRMKGQAFISFKDVETATAALTLVNGYMLKDKPIIIMYGKKS